MYFTIIKNTVATFKECFPTLQMSACVKWAKEQVDAFNILLARQLSGTEEGGTVWTACMNQAKHHANMLSEVALDFQSLIGRESTVQGDTTSGPVGLGLT